MEFKIGDKVVLNPCAREIGIPPQHMFILYTVTGRCDDMYEIQNDDEIIYNVLPCDIQHLSPKTHRFSVGDEVKFAENAGDGLNLASRSLVYTVIAVDKEGYDYEIENAMKDVSYYVA